jgi:hypothetical protein
MQEYFLVACSLPDAVRRFQRSNSDWLLFPEKAHMLYCVGSSFRPGDHPARTQRKSNKSRRIGKTAIDDYQPILGQSAYDNGAVGIHAVGPSQGTRQNCSKACRLLQADIPGCGFASQEFARKCFGLEASLKDTILPATRVKSPQS